MRYYLLLGSFFFIASCGIFTSAPERSSRPRPNEEKPSKVEKKKEDEPEKVKKSEFDKKEVYIPADTSLMTRNEDKPDFRKKNIYSLHILLPLVPIDEGGMIEENETRKSSSHSAVEEKLLPFNVHFIDYLSGFTLSLQEARQRNSSFNYRLNVKASGDMDAHITASAFDTISPKPDVILGGIQAASVDALTSLSARENIYYISPWITSTPTSDNPLFLQLTPGLNEYCHFLADQVTKDSIQPQLTILTAPAFADRLDIFTEYFEQNHSDFSFHTWIVDTFKVENKQLVDPPFWMDTDAPQSVIIAMDRDESFLYDALSYFSELESWEGKIYGFSSWRNFPLLYEFFEKGDIRLISHTLPFRKDSSYMHFEEKYFEKYATLPSSWAAKGYDHGLFIAEGLTHYGLDFYAHLDQIPYQGVQLFFKFPAQQDETIEGLPLLPLKNQGVQLLKYEDHNFRLEND